MKTNVHLWSYLAHFLEWEMFQTKDVEKMKTHVLSSVTFFRKSCRLWGNAGQYWTSRTGHSWQYGACALHTGYLRLQIHTLSLYNTFSCHPSPPTILPSSLTSSCHLFLGLALNSVVPKFIYSTLLGILFPSILCTCPNQHTLFNRIVSIRVGF